MGEWHPPALPGLQPGNQPYTPSVPQYGPPALPAYGAAPGYRPTPTYNPTRALGPDTLGPTFDPLPTPGTTGNPFRATVPQAAPRLAAPNVPSPAGSAFGPFAPVPSYSRTVPVGPPWASAPGAAMPGVPATATVPTLPATPGLPALPGAPTAVPGTPFSGYEPPAVPGPYANPIRAGRQPVADNYHSLVRPFVLQNTPSRRRLDFQGLRASEQLQRAALQRLRQQSEVLQGTYRSYRIEQGGYYPNTWP